MIKPHILIAAMFLLGAQHAIAGDSAYSWQPQQQNAGESGKPGWSDIAQEVLMNALSLTGIKYTYGGKSPETGFDCSGFVRYVFQQSASMTLPHGAKAISRMGQTVSPDQLQPGDLVFFNTLKSAFSHVGIYLGDNKFIHAPSSGGGIQVVNMKDSYWSKRFNGARRIDSDDKSAASSLSSQ
ncbi:C40 family peptidase [Methylobacillus caricis]|uniref:C40 family peptidase n=1 Tax=Methylobacillus caricis TaxID=1971611 RepID=UPI001CFF66D2|nr:C40 family peptidase [Methylobacillus caricis]MCB5186493.1 C40 family peptidase [Methylobacillus caricis]